LEPTGMVNVVSESRIDHVFKQGVALMRGMRSARGGKTNSDEDREKEKETSVNDGANSRNGSMDGSGNSSGSGSGSGSGSDSDASYREALRIAGRDVIGGAPSPYALFLIDIFASWSPSTQECRWPNVYLLICVGRNLAKRSLIVETQANPIP